MSPLPLVTPSSRYVPVSRWVEDNLSLPENSPRPGPVNLHAFQREMLDCLDEPGVKQETLMLPVQMSKSSVMVWRLGYHLDVRPIQTFLAHHSGKIYQRFRRQNLLPMIKSCPSLKGKLKLTERLTIPADYLEVPGGSVEIGLSGSKAGLRQVSARLTIADELDVFQPNADGTNPMDSLRGRGAEYGDRAQLLVGSSPTREHESYIYLEYQRSDRREWWVPCQKCSWEGVLSWEACRQVNGTWTLYCQSCGGAYTDPERWYVVAAGRWVVTNPAGEAGHAGFHLTRLNTMTERLDAAIRHQNPAQAIGFRTQFLGLPYSTSPLAPPPTHEEWADGALEDIPADPTLVTAGVDVQQNRLEVQVVSWQEYEPTVIAYERLPMTLDEDVVWRQLRELLDALDVDYTGVDRGYKGNEVREALNRVAHDLLRSGRLKLTLGYQGNSFSKPYISEIKTRPYEASLGTDALKLTIHEWLRSKRLGYVGAALPADYLDQLLAEEMVPRTDGRGYRWVLIPNRRNEALDTLAIATGMRFLPPSYYSKRAMAKRDAKLSELQDFAAGGQSFLT